MYQPYQHYLHFLHNRELSELYASISLRSFALSFIGVFIPIYLIQEGYAIASVFLFYAIASAVHAIVIIPAAKICSRYGFKHSILFSIPFLILALIGLYSLHLFAPLFYIVPMLFGMSGGLFWMGYHLDFTIFSNKKHRGKEISFAHILFMLFSAAGPFVGGLTVFFFGFKIMFMLSSVILLLSTIPLFISKDTHRSFKFSLEKPFEKRKIKDLLAFLGLGIETSVGNVIWPIFIFFMIFGEKYTSLGSVTTFSIVFSSIFITIIGRFSDKNRRLTLKLGVAANALVWIVRTFVSTVSQVFIIDAFYGVTKISKNIPFEAVS